RAADRAARRAAARPPVPRGGEFAPRRDLRDQVIEQRGHRARHAGMKARVLPQDRRSQRRARARQPGDEMEDALRHAGSLRFNRTRHFRLTRPAGPYFYGSLPKPERKHGRPWPGYIFYYAVRRAKR